MTGTTEPGLASPILDARRLSLPGGELQIALRRADLPLDTLCGFGARRNPRRGFLFVSRVLGRHIPARPSVMRDVCRRLAAKIPDSLPGPVLVIAMAEMAICMGQTVFEEMERQKSRDDILFCHSTRFRLNAPIAIDFHEEHSHATNHLVHLPDNPEYAEMLRSARSLVLIDDEMSTGSTFVNLAKAFARTYQHLEQVVTVVLTDWTGPQRLAALEEAMPAPYQSVSLLEGEYTYTPSPTTVAIDMPNVIGNGEDKTYLFHTNYGRLGIRRPPDVPDAIREQAAYRPGEKVLVLGTGEFAYLPFRLAEQLEADGADVYCQATTRSPILVALDIGSALDFSDNYDDGIVNFLYNAQPGQYDRVLIGYETPARTVQAGLVSMLNAQPLVF